VVRVPEGRPDPLPEHVRRGRQHLPPLVATDVVRLADWVRDDLPDLLWPALVLQDRGTTAARDFVHWQAAVLRGLAGFVEPALIVDGLDGRLTGLDRLADLHPNATEIVRHAALDNGLLPAFIADILSSYPGRPGSWLFEGEFRSMEQADAERLAAAIGGAIGDGHREAVIKCLPIWAGVQAGTFKSNSETIELLKGYPTDRSPRTRADSVVRAAWGASKGAALETDDGRFDKSIQWAKLFWGTNSHVTRCVRGRELDPPPQHTVTTPEGPPVAEPDAPDGEHLQQVAMDLIASYVEALETAPARLYDPERQEVHAGLVSRAGREVITALGYADLWSAEHGSHVGRTLVEVRIYLEWMATQDVSIYRRFQDYGAGKAKLYSRIIDELPVEARTGGFSEAIDELGRLAHNDSGLDVRVVDTGDSFSGKSIRAMAEECGLLDLYRHAYYITSGVVHSEWWSVETHAMERCQNILHRGHLIPSLSLSAGANVDLARSWVDQIYSLMWWSLGVLGTDQTSVNKAFEWLNDNSRGSD
jgi:hypothetical protein